MIKKPTPLTPLELNITNGLETIMGWETLPQVPVPRLFQMTLERWPFAKAKKRSSVAFGVFFFEGKIRVTDGFTWIASENQHFLDRLTDEVIRELGAGSFTSEPMDYSIFQETGDIHPPAMAISHHDDGVSVREFWDGLRFLQTTNLYL